MGHREAKANAREAVRLAEGAGDDQSTVKTSIPQELAAVRVRGKISVGFVQHKHAVVRQQFGQLICRPQSACGGIWIRNKKDPQLTSEISGGCRVPVP